jgi:nucleotide-binding universal stress UspA family protein
VNPDEIRRFADTTRLGHGAIVRKTRPAEESIMTRAHCFPPDHTLPRREQQTALAAASASLWPRRVLVAIDGTIATDPAIRAALFFARHAGSEVDMAVIYTPRIPVPHAPERRGMDACERHDRVDAAHLIATVRSRYHDLVADRAERAGWQFHLEVGDPGGTLVRLAGETRPDLVIVGLAQREPLDGHSGGRTAVCASRYLTAALLAAASDDEVPSRSIVALPDGKLHAPTLRAALACVSRPAKVWLAFPERHSALAPDISDSEAIAAAVRELCGDDTVNNLEDVRFERLDIVGDMLNDTLRHAEELSAQLIAIPNRGVPGPVRAFLPNLAEPLLVSARCSVLVVPDAE